MHKGNAIIIGGHCSHPFSTVQVYSVDKNIWTKQVATPVARSYHSSVLYKNRFVITFGGMGVYDVSRKAVAVSTPSLYWTYHHSQIVNYVCIIKTVYNHVVVIHQF